jgi:hypothetical protein
MLLVFNGGVAAAVSRGVRCPVVLGSVRAIGPHDAVGWGTCRPRSFTNGGDAVGQVVRIRWSSWGGPVAQGRGFTADYGPNGGGVTANNVVIYLRAFDLGPCVRGGPRSYRRLEVRVPSRNERWKSWDPSRRTICNSY